MCMCRNVNARTSVIWHSCVLFMGGYCTGSGKSSPGESGRPWADIPQPVWRHVAAQLSVPDLVKAAATSRVFQECQGERERAAINRCLEAAEARWGPDLLPKLGTMSSLWIFGLHPLTLRDHRRRLCSAALTWGPDGRLRVTPAPHFAGVNSMLFAPFSNSRFGLHVILGSTFIRVLSGEGGTARSPILSISVNLGEVQAALGLLLGVMQVKKQEVVRPAGASLSTWISLPWWLQYGCFECVSFSIEVPREDVREHMDGRGNLRKGAGRKIWQRALETEGADVMCVARALQVPSIIAVNVIGEKRGGFCEMWRSRGMMAGDEGRRTHQT